LLNVLEVFTLTVITRLLRASPSMVRIWAVLQVITRQNKVLTFFTFTLWCFKNLIIFLIRTRCIAFHISLSIYNRSTSVVTEKKVCDELEKGMGKILVRLTLIY